MLGARPKKMMNMYIYDILRRNTDAEHPMTQRELQKRLESDYDMTVDRKAVKANLEDLINEMPEENIDGLIEHEKNNAPENKKEDK